MSSRLAASRHVQDPQSGPDFIARLAAEHRRSAPKLLQGRVDNLAIAIGFARAETIFRPGHDHLEIAIGLTTENDAPATAGHQSASVRPLRRSSSDLLQVSR